MQRKASLDQLQDYRLLWNEEKKREGIMPRKHEKKHFHLTVEVCREAVLKGCFLHLPCYLGNSQNKDEQNVKILQLG